MWWLNPMLVRGYSNILSLADVYPLDHDLYSEILRERMETCWEKCKYTYTLEGWIKLTLAL